MTLGSKRPRSRLSMKNDTRIQTSPSTRSHGHGLQCCNERRRWVRISCKSLLLVRYYAAVSRKMLLLCRYSG